MRRIFPLLLLPALLFAEVTTRLEISGDILKLSYSDSRDAVIFRRDNSSGYNVPPMKIDIPGKWTLDKTPPKPAQALGKTFPPGIVGEEYSHVLKASGKGARFSAKGLPAGLRISSSGRITGRPEQAGLFTVEVTERRKSRQEKSTFTLEISEPKRPVVETEAKSEDIKVPQEKSVDIPPAKPKRPPIILSSSINQAFNGEEFSFTLKASVPVTWSCDSLPEGLSLDSETGIISGIPVADFGGKIDVTATNDEGSTTRPLQFAVKTRRPHITTSILPYGFVSEDYLVELKADGGNGITWTFRGKIPDGLSFSKSGVIHGVPEEAGQFTVNVSARNSGGESSRRFSLSISESTPHEYVTAAVIPAFVASDDGRYDFPVSIDSSVPEGSYIEWHSFPYGLESEGESYTFTDSRGNEVRTVPANHNLTVSAYLEGGVSYEPVITARVKTSEPKAEELTSQQGTYSGCNMTGIMGMIILIHTIKKRGKNHESSKNSETV